MDTQAGPRQLQTKAGEVKLKVPKLRNLPFVTAIIERYKRREPSVEKTGPFGLSSLAATLVFPTAKPLLFRACSVHRFGLG